MMLSNPTPLHKAEYCETCPPGQSRMFCIVCGRVLDKSELKKVRLMGAVGVAHSSSENIRRFWATGDPTGV